LPTVAASTVPVSLKRARHLSTSALASSSRPRSVSTSEYSSAGFRFSAWLAGSVQAVVVQITANASLPFNDGRPKAAASLSGSAHKKPTSTVCDFLSAYSISNSASDEPQSKHQYTGFRPR
jgi:hypothetical protein